MSDFDTLDLDVFLSDFAETVTATTWGKTINGIFDEEYVDFEDISRTTPALLVKTSDVPAAPATGDLFTVGSDNYKLVDVQYAEPGLSRLVLAAV